jgi:hypothetical protein
MKYGILMPYFNRRAQFRMTLVSFKHHYGHRDDWRVVVVVDRKDKDPDGVASTIKSLGLSDRCLVFQSPSEGESNCPAREYNAAAEIADARFVMPTNPENLHKTDILGEMDKLFAENGDRYVICACQSVVNVSMPGDDFAGLSFNHKEWFQHSLHNNHRLNFCSALSFANYKRIGGFDTDFEAGLGYCDDDFLDRVVDAGIEVMVRDDMLSLHLEHEITNKGDRGRLARMNQLLYARKQARRRVMPA